MAGTAPPPPRQAGASTPWPRRRPPVMPSMRRISSDRSRFRRRTLLRWISGCPVASVVRYGRRTSAVPASRCWAADWLRRPTGLRVCSFIRPRTAHVSRCSCGLWRSTRPPPCFGGWRERPRAMPGPIAGWAILWSRLRAPKVWPVFRERRDAKRSRRRFRLSDDLRMPSARAGVIHLFLCVDRSRLSAKGDSLNSYLYLSRPSGIPCRISSLMQVYCLRIYDIGVQSAHYAARF